MKNGTFEQNAMARKYSVRRIMNEINCVGKWAMAMEFEEIGKNLL